MDDKMAMRIGIFRIIRKMFEAFVTIIVSRNVRVEESGQAG